jgi:hypothetical protein
VLVDFRDSVVQVPGAEKELREVSALLAYEDPEQSPLSGLLSAAHKEHVADVVNGAMLAAEEGEGGEGMDVGADNSGFKPSMMEAVMAQLSTVQREDRVARGNQGELFQLQNAICGSWLEGT